MLARCACAAVGWGNAWPTEVAKGWLPEPGFIYGDQVREVNRVSRRIRSPRGRRAGNSSFNEIHRGLLPVGGTFFAGPKTALNEPLHPHAALHRRVRC